MAYIFEFTLASFYVCAPTTGLESLGSTTNSHADYNEAAASVSQALRREPPNASRFKQEPAIAPMASGFSIIAIRVHAKVIWSTCSYASTFYMIEVGLLGWASCIHAYVTLTRAYLITGIVFWFKVIVFAVLVHTTQFINHIDIRLIEA